MLSSEQGTAGRRNKWWKETNDLHVCFLESGPSSVGNRRQTLSNLPISNSETKGHLCVYHLPLDTCGVCSPIFAEYRMNLNGSVFWYFSISLR